MSPEPDQARVFVRAAMLGICAAAFGGLLKAASGQMTRIDDRATTPSDLVTARETELDTARESLAATPELPGGLLAILPPRGREAAGAVLDYLNGLAEQTELHAAGIDGNLHEPRVVPVDDSAHSTVRSTGKGSIQARTDSFRQLKALARDGGSVRVIAHVAVPNIEVLTQAAVSARGGAAANADAQLATAIAAAVQRETGALARTQHRVVRTFNSIPFVALEVSERALAALERSAGIIGIEEDKLARPMLDKSIGNIGADEAWDLGFDGAGQHVAILDTGILASHQMFAGKDIVQACFSTSSSGTGGDCPNGSDTDTTSADAARPFPSNFAGYDHGTHVAGISAGNDPDPSGLLDGGDLWRTRGLFGVAREADIIAVQVFHKVENSTSCGTAVPSDCLLSFSSDQAGGLDHVFSLRSNLSIASANMSLGGGKYDNQTTCDNDNASVKAAIDNLRNAGIATVIASGNEDFCDGIAGPACISSAVAVGAVDDSDSETSFSNYFDGLLDLYAPGSQIRSAVGTSDNAYGNKSGTSMAAPHVAGAWAVMKDASPGASVAAVLQALQTTGASVNGRCVATPNQRRIQLDAAVFRHNGRLVSNGSDEVRADLFWSSVPGGFFAARQFLEPAPHSVRHFYPRFVDTAVLTVELAVRNETGAAWTGYTIDLAGADFIGINRGNPRGPAARDVDPVVERFGFSEGDILFLDDRGEPGRISVGGSWITRGAEDATLTILFDDPVDPGEAFLLAYFVRDIGYRDTHFTLTATPIE